ncbi:MAG: lactate utilization protein [Candidatus Bathyarchaeota archaeon]|nr:lactate utilization protein [Candidatus Bathyarchaeota archaeon]MCZ2845135.1 lactate utilization protein [Candidatus Bathyarchaeota archaeon]
MRVEKKWFIEGRAQRVIEALRNNGFDAIYLQTKEEAFDKIMNLIPKGSLVGIGGSVTIREIGLVDALVKRGNKLAEDWLKKYSMEEKLSIRRQQLTADVFLTSSNAVTEDGELINIDGLGNRVGAMIFGPKKVIVVAGINKIVKDSYEGIERIRNIAAPMNVKRLGGKTPCLLTGNCDLDECEPPNRNCHIITIIEKRPMKTDMTIVLVGEELGF